MDELKNFIDINREEFEKDILPANHKERFISKLHKSMKAEARSYRIKKVNFYLAAASVTLFLILTPLLYLNKIHKNRTLDVTDYIGIIKDNSATVTKMAETLNPLEKEMVLNTLEELTFEAIPFDSQLSDDVKNGERGELLKMYYSPKIEGIEKLKKYVAQLNNN